MIVRAVARSLKNGRFAQRARLPCGRRDPRRMAAQGMMISYDGLVEKISLWLFSAIDGIWLMLRGAGTALIGKERTDGLTGRLGIRRFKNRYWRHRTTLPDGSRLVYRPFDKCVIDEIHKKKAYGGEGVFLPGQTVVDLGGHIGIFTLYAARRVGPQGRVVVCEPGVENLALLRKNVELNRFGQVSIHSCAVADRAGEAYFFTAANGVDNPVTDSLIGGAGRRRERVSVRTLDDILDEERLDRIDHLKIDVEGAEGLVLKGAPRSLMIASRIVIEVHAPAADPKEISATLEGLGFQIIALSDAPLVIEARRRS